MKRKLLWNESAELYELSLLKKVEDSYTQTLNISFNSYQLLLHILYFKDKGGKREGKRVGGRKVIIFTGPHLVSDTLQSALIWTIKPMKQLFQFPF